MSICEPKVTNENDPGSIVHTCSNAETTQIPIYNRTGKYIVVNNLCWFLKYSHQLFNTTPIKTGGLGPLPLNPDRPASISTNRVRWMRCHVTPKDSRSQEASSGNPDNTLRKAKASWRSCNQGTAVFTATTVLVTSYFQNRRGSVCTEEIKPPTEAPTHAMSSWSLVSHFKSPERESSSPSGCDFAYDQRDC